MINLCQLAEAQTVYSERSPYVEVPTLQNSTQVIFDQVFIDLYRKALSTDCVDDMSEWELQFLYEFIDYQNGIYDDKFVQALDLWTMNELNCIPNPTIGQCDGIDFTYVKCDGSNITV